MKKILTVFGRTLSVSKAAEIDSVMSWFNAIRWFRKDLSAFRNKLKGNTDFEITKLYPILTDKYVDAGEAKGPYFHQDLLIAQLIYKASPVRHIDIGSRMDGFITHVASYREIETVDIRPLESKITNIKFLQMDLMKDVDHEFENITNSLSCLHVIEHFGLGRYGDEIDPDGHIKGFKNMSKLLKPGGTFYFSTPIGKQRIEFNANRVFNVRYLLNMVKDDFIISDFYFVNDDGDLEHPETWQNDIAIDKNFGCFHGCGIFVLKKR